MAYMILMHDRYINEEGLTVYHVSMKGRVHSSEVKVLV